MATDELREKARELSPEQLLREFEDVAMTQGSGDHDYETLRSELLRRLQAQQGAAGPVRPQVLQDIWAWLDEAKSHLRNNYDQNVHACIEGAITTISVYKPEASPEPRPAIRLTEQDTVNRTPESQPSAGPVLDHFIDTEVATVAREDGWPLPDANLITFGRLVWKLAISKTSFLAASHPRAEELARRMPSVAKELDQISQGSHQRNFGPERYTGGAVSKLRRCPSCKGTPAKPRIVYFSKLDGDTWMYSRGPCEHRFHDKGRKP